MGDGVDFIRNDRFTRGSACCMEDQAVLATKQDDDFSVYDKTLVVPVIALSDHLWSFVIFCQSRCLYRTVARFYLAGTLIDSQGRMLPSRLSQVCYLLHSMFSPIFSITESSTVISHREKYLQRSRHGGPGGHDGGFLEPDRHTN